MLNKWRSLAPDPPSACLAAIKTVSLCPGRNNTSLNRSCTDRPRIVLQGLTRNAVFAHPLVRRSLPAQTRKPVSALDGIAVLIRASVRHILDGLLNEIPMSFDPFAACVVYGIARCLSELLDELLDFYQRSSREVLVVQPLS